MITKQKKEEILKKLEDKLKKAAIAVFVNFHGLDMEATMEVRRTLRKTGAGYMVAKKTLIKKALDSLKIDGDIPEFGGEIGVAFSESDSLEPVSALGKFSKKKSESFNLVGGIFEKKYLDKKGILNLANLPSREILLGQFVNIINSPIQGLVVALNERVKKIT